MKEKYVEQKLVLKVKRHGGACPEWASLNLTDWYPS